MKYSYRIATAWGIPIELHLTFILLIAAVAVLSYPSFYSFALIVFLFVFVVLHELAHTLVAKHYNIRVRKIVLYPIGGVSEIEEIPQNPRVEWRLALAGPLVSILIGVVLLVASLAVGISVPISISLITVGNFLADLAWLNLFLGAFNLIPAFPMDGGRVFRALLAQRLDFADATKYAVYVGRLLGIGMIVFGIVFPPYFLLIFVGLFVYVGAGEEAEQTKITSTLARILVSDIPCAPTSSLHPQNTLAEAMETMSKSQNRVAIVESDGVYEGLIALADLTKITPEQRGLLTVGQMPLKKVFIFQNDSALDAQKLMIKERLDVLPVVDFEKPSRVVCVLTFEGLSTVYDIAKRQR
jgi:Zn-dependent protease